MWTLSWIKILRYVKFVYEIGKCWDAWAFRLWIETFLGKITNRKWRIIRTWIWLFLEWWIGRVLVLWIN